MDEVTSDEGFVVLKPLELAYVVKCLSLASKPCCRAVLHELFKLLYMEVSWTTIFQIRIPCRNKTVHDAQDFTKTMHQIYYMFRKQ